MIDLEEIEEYLKERFPGAEIVYQHEAGWHSLRVEHAADSELRIPDEAWSQTPAAELIALLQRSDVDAELQSGVVEFTYDPLDGIDFG
jgi:hypothetical protein